MEKIILPGTDLNISRLGLGTVKFGRNQGVKYPTPFDLPTEKELAELLAIASELGINLLDTSPAYGLSEKRLGRLLKGQRDKWVIISKAGEEFENGVSRHDFSPFHLEQSLARTLTLLNTDHLDILLLHCADDDVANMNDDVIQKLQDFKKRGLVKAFGASTKSIEGGLRAVDLLDVVMCTPDQTAILDKAKHKSKVVLLKKIFGSGHAADKNAAMRAAFAHLAVTAAIVGTITPQHLRENARSLAACLTSSSAA